MKLIIATPLREEEIESVEYVRLPTIDGYIGILDNHISSIVALEPGDIKYRKEGKIYYLWGSGGYAEITKNKVLIIAESVEKPEEIDIKQAEKEVDKISQKVKTYGPLAGFVMAGVDLKKNVNKLKFVTRFGRK
ncbi:MAG: F0F1 ATP synthase subunit epsilon [Candidatus Neomarinimicrobiota bacterium]|nr:F0F1 ATP synthase subunit epsilon [Candidatus Neomarinimicrobiota bacterium]MCD6100948.1 F0F1 ATP synthase subunit epsilon [Candidatus Neomarinimicrobiota bacterium]RKY46757.1 MAG: F0F1 ATP synthase subunit epsilon [Candidatus Neomarinimicrobiota bacterium]RKY49342.1 MAG: F0F1 ATP synthase subunit epsilon [Candidatus Neomarinimicrobiota bacterium]RKY52650.1 MAG: F0F1 ATP synthase subunit epsilon [Candidatus Neomarinimicrobiota bacterium]